MVRASDPGRDQPPHAESSHAGSLRAESLLLTTVALGAVLAPLNSTMIAVALPAITTELGAGAAATSWLVTAYLISMASLQPVAGRLGDRLGRRRLILGGLAGFTIASLGAMLAANLPLLIVCRVAQAVSGAVVLPNGDALLREVVPDERRASRFGMIGSAIGLAAALGPVVGGLVVTTVGWRAMFGVNLLLVLPALALGWACIPRGERRDAPAVLTPPTPRRPFDWPGAVLLSTVLVGLALLLSRGGGQDAALLLLETAALILLFGVFLWRELRHPEPVLQPRFFLRPAFAAATGAVGLSNLAMYTVLLALPILWARDGRAAAEIGSLLGVMAAAMVVASPVGGRLADRLGRRWPAALGLTILTLGTVVIGLAAANGFGALWPVMLGLGVLGGGLGLATPGMQASALESVERQNAGAAAGAYSTSRYLGSIVGSALLAGLASLATGGPAGAAPAGLGLTPIFAVVAAAALLSALLALRLPGRRTR
ncbi:MAG: MFS transporter [Chloroflexi bacterium]|nr:MFS transporter [Chloroflexota bacterium]